MKSLSAAADILTLISLIYAFFYGLVNRNRTVSGFVIARFIAHLLKFAIIIFTLTILYRISQLIYIFCLIVFKDSFSSNTYYWENGYEIAHLVAYFIFGVFYLAIALITITFIWTGSLNQTKYFLNSFLPKNRQLSIKHFKTLNIVSAKYGAKESFFDVTEKLKSMINKNTLTITASNDIAGDPIFGEAKSLIITYQYDSEKEKTLKIEEKSVCTIEPD